jgi:hypothetical protein
MDEDLKHFDVLIVDRAKAEKEGRIIPPRGTDETYDEALGNVEGAESVLDEYLQEQRKKFKSQVSSLIDLH